MLKDIGINKQILVTHIEPKTIINFICIYGDGSKTLSDLYAPRLYA